MAAQPPVVNTHQPLLVVVGALVCRQPRCPTSCSSRQYVVVLVGESQPESPQAPRAPQGRPGCWMLQCYCVVCSVVPARELELPSASASAACFGRCAARIDAPRVRPPGRKAAPPFQYQASGAGPFNWRAPRRGRRWLCLVRSSRTGSTV